MRRDRLAPFGIDAARRPRVFSVASREPGHPAHAVSVRFAVSFAAVANCRIRGAKCVGLPDFHDYAVGGQCRQVAVTRCWCSAR